MSILAWLYRKKPPRAVDTVPKECEDDLLKWKATGRSAVLQRCFKAGLTEASIVDTGLGMSLHVAAKHGFLDSLFFLHACGVKDHIVNSEGCLAVHLAAASGHRDCVLYMLKNMDSDINAPGRGGYTPLMFAIDNNNITTVSALLARGAIIPGITTKDGSDVGSGLTAIHLCRSPEMLRLLLANTTLHVDSRSNKGQTLLHVCGARGDTATAAEAMAVGANFAAVDENGRNALHHACMNGASHTVPFLVKARCSASDCDNEGFTPVELALVRHDCDTAYALYCAGAMFTKRQLLLLSILLRHSTLLKAIQEERHEQPKCVQCDSAAVKVEEQAKSLLEPKSEGYAGSNLSKLVVSYGRVPPEVMSADSLQDSFHKLRDPIPRPAESETSAVLLSVYSRFLRHSDSTTCRERCWAEASATERQDGEAAPQQHAPSPNGHPGESQTVTSSRRSDSHALTTAAVHSLKHSKLNSGAVQDSRAEHPSSSKLQPSDATSDEAYMAQQHKAAQAKLCRNTTSGGRDSLERLLPHYLLGLTPRRSSSGCHAVVASSGCTRASLSQSSVSGRLSRQSLVHARESTVSLQHEATNAVRGQPVEEGVRPDVRQSLFFSRGRTQPSGAECIPVRASGMRRSRTFDMGYMNRANDDYPSKRGPWGEPSHPQGPGAVAALWGTAGAQDDMVTFSNTRQVTGKELQDDGMLEFEEMMARRVLMFKGEYQQEHAAGVIDN